MRLCSNYTIHNHFFFYLGVIFLIFLIFLSIFYQFFINFLSTIFCNYIHHSTPFLHLPTLAPSCVTTKRVPCGRLSDVLTIILMQGSHSSSGGGEPRGSWGRLEDRGRLGGRISPSSGESVRIRVRCEDVRV